MLVGLHVRQGCRRFGQRKHLVDRQGELAGFHRRPQICDHAAVDLAHLINAAGAEGDADILDAPGRMQVEVEIAPRAAETADIHDPAQDGAAFQIAIGHAGGNLIHDHVHAAPAGGFQHLIGPAGIRGVDREVGAEFGQPRPAAGVGGTADDQARAHHLGDLHAHQADAGTGALDQDALPRLQRTVGHHRIMHGGQRHRQRGGLFPTDIAAGNFTDDAVIGDGILSVPAAALGHHPHARPDMAWHFRADLHHLAGEFQADDGARPADAAMGMAGGDAEIGTVQPGGANPDQHLLRTRLRVRHILYLHAVFGNDGCLHGCLLPFRDGLPCPPRYVSAIRGGNPGRITTIRPPDRGARP